MGSGHARGGAPGSRLAVYKACWFGTCSYADVLAAFDDAIADGVDVITMSVGAATPTSYFLDPFSFGSLHAFRKGIVVCTSAGNEGGAATVVNVSPWMLTVAASSTDRSFNSYVSLGNSKVLRGSSLNPKILEGSHPIIAGGAAVLPGVPAANASYCQNNTLNHELVAGKIVVCHMEGLNVNRPQKSVVVQQYGGVGMILIDPAYVDEALEFVLPTVLIGGTHEAMELEKYLNLERDPVGEISKTTTVNGGAEAPVMAVFSSTGPNIVTPDIIKPDITAPGVNILAAWSPVALTSFGQVDYNIESGTSMACPHAAGAAAIVRSRHPDWSPAAVKSALMTTATVLDNKHGPILRNHSSATPFDYGSGHLNPIAALNPGLVYDFGPGDIINFLCSNSTNASEIEQFTGEALINCRNPLVPSYDLNYPSIGVANMRGVSTVHRTVTNVQDGHWVYHVLVQAPDDVLVHVVPERLEFFKGGEKQSFRVDLVPLRRSNGSFVFGSITWTDRTHWVRSPIAVNVVSV